MQVADVEIYSDTSNFVVMRHPGRKFPGALIQGDSLYALCKAADSACDAARAEGRTQAYEEIAGVRDALSRHLNHYKEVLASHGIQLPFVESGT